MDHEEIDNKAPDEDPVEEDAPTAEEPVTEDEWLEEDPSWEDPDALTEVFEEQPVVAAPVEQVPAAAPGIDMPVEEQRKRALALAGISVVLFFVGYLIGNTNGSDIEAAQAEGKKAGTAAGLGVGKKQGYEEGFEKGEETAFKAAYSKAYRAANPNGVPDAAEAFKDR